ncbi:Zinc finger protein sens-like [Dissostichus eleginoides]|uniref:Zinc finger protein sens-like n=1 Tax=Dissostichus eleginoides TaxID=100907 RepID=A0AAD9BC93_DISEL|nr:Zinc finger protein sens-like [Dissostichus eleginoides]
MVLAQNRSVREEEGKSQHPRGESQLWGGNEEGRSGRAGELRTGEEAEQRCSLSLSLSLVHNTTPPIPARQTDRRLGYQCHQRPPLGMRGTSVWRLNNAKERQNLENK